MSTVKCRGIPLHNTGVFSHAEDPGSLRRIWNIWNDCIKTYVFDVPSWQDYGLVSSYLTNSLTDNFDVDISSVFSSRVSHHHRVDSFVLPLRPFDGEDTVALGGLNMDPPISLRYHLHDEENESERTVRHCQSIFVGVWISDHTHPVDHVIRHTDLHQSLGFHLVNHAFQNRSVWTNFPKCLHADAAPGLWWCFVLQKKNITIVVIFKRGFVYLCTKYLRIRKVISRTNLSKLKRNTLFVNPHMEFSKDNRKY